MNTVLTKQAAVKPIVGNGRRNLVLFLLFFCSGFCGLVYQTVWMRLAFASFGVITPVVSVIISVFMLGLGLGSWLAGKYIATIRQKTGLSAMAIYGIAEGVIGLGAFVVPLLFSSGEAALLRSGQSDSVQYLLLSGSVIAASVLLFSTAMGTTFPLVMSFVRECAGEDKGSFSFLYVANVAGAVLGCLATVLILVELLGFRQTLCATAGINWAISAVAIIWSARLGAATPPATQPEGEDKLVAGRENSALMYTILFVTGFTSMAMEVVWTREFTVTLGSLVYSFAKLLALYLLMTCAGSIVYRFDLKRGAVKLLGFLIAMLSISALLPIFANDARFPVQHLIGGALLIAPFCLLLGYLTPLLIDELSLGNEVIAGRAYAINVLGCITGPLVAGYFLLPAMSIRIALVALAVPYLVLSIPLCGRFPKPARFAVLSVPSMLVILSLFCHTWDEGNHNGENFSVKRDHVATVLALGHGMDKHLLVNGIGMTGLTPICKFIADLPLAFCQNKPTNALAICFGMGTSYRSLMSWPIKVTAVELVPSVKDSFWFFHADANQVLRKPNGQIVVDDGRRFLKRTHEMFDVILMDPPPPVEAAGSSMLYSREFYAELSRHLKPGGVAQQWYPQSGGAIAGAVARTVSQSFPHVRVFRSVEGWGYHFLMSNQPIPDLTAEQIIAKMPPAARADLAEWSHAGEGSDAMKSSIDKVVRSQIDIKTMFNDKTPVITDDRPFNEYYVVRRLFGSAD